MTKSLITIAALAMLAGPADRARGSYLWGPLMSSPKIAARGEALGQNPCQVVTTFPSLDACNRYADLTHGSLTCYAIDVPSWHRPN